jgi:hypothetical protein
MKLRVTAGDEVSVGRPGLVPPGVGSEGVSVFAQAVRVDARSRRQEAGVRIFIGAF